MDSTLGINEYLPIIQSVCYHDKVNGLFDYFEIVSKFLTTYQLVYLLSIINI
jgi:hypothetical protein